MSGFADMISMNIRSTTVALATPDAAARPRARVENVFICASNELGAFESGVAAALLGAAPAVVAGGVVTIGSPRSGRACSPRSRASTGWRTCARRCRSCYFRATDGDRPHPADSPPRRGQQPPGRDRGRDCARGARDLVATYPPLRERIFDESDELPQFLNVFIDGTDIRLTTGSRRRSEPARQ